MKIVILKIEYDYVTSNDNKTISITREDSAFAKFHDNENIVNDWEEWLFENIQDLAFVSK